jgi:hypothetical protein
MQLQLKKTTLTTEELAEVETKLISNYTKIFGRGEYNEKGLRILLKNALEGNPNSQSKLVWLLVENYRISKTCMKFLEELKNAGLKYAEKFLKDITKYQLFGFSDGSLPKKVTLEKRRYN